MCILGYMFMIQLIVINSNSNSFYSLIILQFFFMKKYQNWLETRLYSHHLSNLTKIRQQHAKTIHDNLQTRSAANFKIRNLKRKKRQDQAYYIYYQNEKHNLSRKDNFDLQEENSRMAQRILFVQPVVSSVKHKEFYEKYKTISRKMESKGTPNAERDKTLSRFLKTQQFKNISWYHRYMIRVKNIELSQNFASNQFSTIWLEIKTPEQSVTSDYVHPKTLQTHQFILPLKCQLKIKIPVLINVNFSKGLEYLNLGQFSVDLPEIGTEPRKVTIKSNKKIGLVISFDISYEKLNKKQENLIQS